MWDETIETHRRAVRDAILETTWALVQERGALSVTMSQIATETGIGRATLYKYFPDVESILLAYHRRHVAAHLEDLNRLRDQDGTPGERLDAVLLAFGRICHYRGKHGPDELNALLHRRDEVLDAQAQVVELVRQLILDAQEEGVVRGDLNASELAAFSVSALSAAAAMPGEVAVRRLVAVTLDGLRTPR